MAPHGLINTLAANEDTKVPSHDMVLVFAHVCHDCSPPRSGRWSIPSEGSPTQSSQLWELKEKEKETSSISVFLVLRKNLIFCGEPKSKSNNYY